MKKIIVIALLTFAPIMMFAQASGGQIKRNATKPITEKRNTSKPRRATVKTEQSSPVYTPPVIQTVSVNSLNKYNIQAGCFMMSANADGQCKELREHGFDSKIYFDEPKRMYRVIVVSISGLESAINTKNYIESSYPKYSPCYIFTIVNGETQFLK